jgi:hypothetical protein
MALNFGFDVSFDNTDEWKGIREKAGDDYITYDGTSR